MEIKVSVRQLVEFILRSGDIDNRRTGGADTAMQEGSRIHRMIQKRMGSEYHAEVPLSYVWNTPGYQILIDGRADGIIDRNWEVRNARRAVKQEDTVYPIEEELSAEEISLKDQVVIDEIKGTYKDLKRIHEPVGVHVAQAKCYAFFYAEENQLTQIGVRMTYCNMETEEIKYFHEKYRFLELRSWFEQLMEEYMKWADFQFNWNEKRTHSIKNMEFPFPYRDGQKDLVTYVYRTIYHKRKLFLEAPTGVGKTISTVFPAVKAMGEGLTEKIFYLTAKTITRTVAEECFTNLEKQNLQIKTVTLTAKDKICPLEEANCNPEQCPYARGHYDRINQAMYDLLQNENHFTREKVLEYSEKHTVCPFEMSLDMSLFSDVVICDYNYVFDPKVYLKRFFAEGIGKKDYTFLIDESHNLLERGREMYSASLIKEDFLKVKAIVKKINPKLDKQLEKCNKEMLVMKKQCEQFREEEYIDSFVVALTRAYTTMDELLEEQEEFPERETVLDLYFQISHFLNMYEIMDEKYTAYSQFMSDGSFMLKLFCMDPSTNLKACMAKGRSTILFSATLLPIQYYKQLLGGEQQDYEVYARSTFQEEKRKLLIANDVTTKYSRRNEEEYKKVARYIYEIVKQRYGNYMIFFPSHAFLDAVFQVFSELYYDETFMECLIQQEYMSETMREEFLMRFQGNEGCDFQKNIIFDIEQEEEKILLGFCVMGGIFSEGIDLKEDSLIGTIIVGTGIPQVGSERELLKQYFDKRGEQGFDYAYRYPGMNKVLQAAGRVIRTTEDIGVIVLLDERFLDFQYKKMYPREWSQYSIVSVDDIGKKVEKFWNEWL